MTFGHQSIADTGIRRTSVYFRYFFVSPCNMDQFPLGRLYIQGDPPFSYYTCRKPYSRCIDCFSLSGLNRNLYTCRHLKINSNNHQNNNIEPVPFSPMSIGHQRFEKINFTLKKISKIYLIYKKPTLFNCLTAFS